MPTLHATPTVADMFPIADGVGALLANTLNANVVLVLRPQPSWGLD